MPRVRYTGWEDREPRTGVAAKTSRLRKQIHVRGTRLLFRGYPGRPTSWQPVDEEVANVLRTKDNFEVASE